MDIKEAQEFVGSRVRKRSGKPFKSRLRVNTVASVVEHLQSPKGGLAFTFVEDDSVVGVDVCRTAGEPR